MMKLLVLASLAIAAPAAAQLKDLTYRGAAVKGHLGATPDFPAELTDKPLCERGATAPASNIGCVQINRDGTGTWENDAGPGRRLPATPIRWYLVTDAKGTPLKNDGPERKTWQIIFEFTQDYYAERPGSLMARPASLIMGPPRRAIIDSKYRDY